jgi:hypothetical protein
MSDTFPGCNELLARNFSDKEQLSVWLAGAVAWLTEYVQRGYAHWLRYDSHAYQLADKAFRYACTLNDCPPDTLTRLAPKGPPLGWETCHQVLIGLKSLRDWCDAGGPKGTGAEPDRWLSVSDAARVAACNKGIITRAVDDGALRSNGEAGALRRIDAVDLTRWILDRVTKPEPRESDAAVEQLVKKHVRE